jgi:hypothetical protein
MSLASDDPEHVIVVPGRHFAPTASAGSVTAVSGDKVEGDFAQEGEVAGGGAVAHADGGIIATTREEVADLALDLTGAGDAADRLHRQHRGQPGPATKESSGDKRDN